MPTKLGDNGNVEVRLARPEDRDALVRFMRQLNEAEFALQPDRDLTIQAADEHLAYLEANVAASEGFVTAAERDGELVGFLVAVVDSEEGSYVLPEARRHGYISEVFVAAPARRGGVGRALMLDAEARFRAKGLTAIRISTLVANEAALASYRAQGYRPLYIMLHKAL